jgi:hypothetical protein
MSEIDEVISEKNDLLAGSSSSSKTEEYQNKKKKTKIRKLMCKVGGTFRVLIAKSRVPHIAKFDGTLRAAVHEYITMAWMKLRRSDHFCQFLHVRRLDVNDVWVQVRKLCM